MLTGPLDVALGSCGTATDLRFWDSEGTPIELDHNPFSESCEPCELDAFISPDGRQLAYRYRPDAKWPPQVWDSVATEDWWDHSQDIPAQVVVIDLGSGTELWKIEVTAEVDLRDFDGRYLVVTTVEHPTGRDVVSTIHDTARGAEPIIVPGVVALRRSR